MIVLGGGVRYQFNDNLQIGLGGEKPITDEDKTIMDCRLYFDLVLSY